MAEEPRALSAALAQPAFVTKGGGAAMHAANRHVERWAPEAGASRVRPLRNLGFVDRLVAPWLEAAQRSQSLRLFSQYLSGGMAERAGGAVSWVFPRPWYQDELDWMAAARQITTAPASVGDGPQRTVPIPTMLTTRGTYVAPAAKPVPASLYEYVAPSLSVARPEAAAQTYSPLVPFAAAQAAQVMANVAQRAPKMVGPGLRAVLANVLERAARPEQLVTGIAGRAPELVTPPAPRPDAVAEGGVEQRVIEEALAQRAKIVELQRVARVVAEREMQARSAAAAAVPAAAAAAVPAAAAAPAAAAVPDAERARLEARIAERLAERQQEAARSSQERVTRAQESARLERTQQAARTEAARTEPARTEAARSDSARRARLHDQARDAAARDARGLDVAPEATPPASSPEPRLGAEVAAALSALPPELASAIASNIAQRPEHAAQAIRELDEALRAIELIARTSAAGGMLEATRGPRLAMPAGLGGLIATMSSARANDPRSAAGAAIDPRTGLATDPRTGVTFDPRTGAPARGDGLSASRAAMRVPSLAWLSADAPSSALGAAAAHAPAALAHVAWSDRWLARFAGASMQSLDALDVASASPGVRLAALAAAAPGAVFVAPDFARADLSRDLGGAGIGATAFAPTSTPGATARPAPSSAPIAGMPPVMRFDDNAETPDDVFAAISAAATGSRRRSEALEQAAPTARAAEPPAPRDTAADLVAHAAPSAPGAGMSAALASSPFAAALRHVLPMPAASSFDVRALFGSGLAASYLAGLLEDKDLGPRAWGLESEPRAALDWSPSYVSPDLEAAAAISEPEARGPTPEAHVASHTSLLAPDHAAPLSRRLVDALALPMIGETAAVRGQANERAVAFGAPGMVGDRAQAWSVAQERNAADLSLDFVSPELVLAARVYGLGPAEAAQAARLALAGPGQLSAMAGAVDRTFVAVLGIDADRKTDARARRAPEVKTAYPVDSEAEAPQTASRAMFGVDRRAPRGAFLWPQATIAALGLHAPTPEGELAMPVAALELLAAQAVAEIGTFAALAEPGTSTSTSTGTTAPSATTSGAIASDADVLATAATLVPAARRSKFEQLYVALGQSTAGRQWSPAARAARAIALAGRGEDAVSPRERASIAWDVLPAVYAAPSDAAPESAQSQRRPELVPLAAMTRETGASFTRETGASPTRDTGSLSRETGVYAVESRPGLAPLSSRAGEALGSYVAPAAAPQAASASTAREAALHRAPTAAPELVRTGRPSGRHGGGEVEIPPWFEAAARRMFEDKSGSPDISLAELTLVTSAPSAHVAASSVAAPTAVPHAPMPGTQASTAQTPQIDIEKVANEVYRQILVLMDAARARNGEPYL